MFGYFRLSEGTDGEDGSLSSGCGWLEVLCVWRWELTTDCSSFVCEKVSKSSAVIEVVGGGEGGQRRELHVLKRLRMSGALLIFLRKCEDLAVWTSAKKEKKERKKKGRKKATTDTYSGPMDLLICTILSLPLGVWSDVHEEHQIARGKKGQSVLAWRTEDKCRLDKRLRYNIKWQ